tara:strand:+ start:9718 stop:10218 length:501 start_codon:yes stop_codon:yes gene_type:complete
MKNLQKFLDNFIEKVGYGTSFLVVVMVFLVTLTLFLRYVLSIGSVALQESIMYLHAIFFMIGISFAIKENAHVKIDILSNKFNSKQKNVVFIAGLIFFMIPFSLFVIFISIDMVSNSWEVMEQSSEAGGLNLVYLLKSVIPLTGFLIFLQSISELIKNIISFLNEH